MCTYITQVLARFSRFGFAIVLALVVAVLVISTVPTRAQSPDQSPEPSPTATGEEVSSVLLSATLDVARIGPQLLGFIPGSGGNLSPTEFQVGDLSWRVKLLNLSSGSTLLLMITADNESDDERLADTDFSQPPTQYALTVSGMRYAFDDADITMNYLGNGPGVYLGGVVLTWQDEDLAWSVGDQVPVTLVSIGGSTESTTTTPIATPTVILTPTPTPEPTIPSKPTGLAVATTEGSLDASIDWDDVPEATSYSVRWRVAGPGNPLSDPVEVHTSDAQITVADYGAWVVRVEACNDAGCGRGGSKRFEIDPAPIATPTATTAVTPIATPTVIATPTPESTIPSQPTGLAVATTEGSLDASVDWDDVPGARSYSVRWRVAGPGNPLSDPVKVQTSETQITVADFGGWVVRVEGCNDAGCGRGGSKRFEIDPAPTPTPSESTTATPIATPTVIPTPTPTPVPTIPSKPTGLAVATTEGSLDASVDWDDVPGSTSYSVRWRVAGPGNPLSDPVEVQTSDAQIKMADYGAWVVRIEACNDAGCGRGASKRFQIDPAPTPIPTATETVPCADGAAVANPSANEGLVGDCETLLGLKDTLRGDVELNWSVDTSIASWDGITVGGNPRRVIKIILAYRWMTGIVPAELAELDALEIINLTDGHLSGSIPSELSGLSDLRELNLGVNDLSGTVPAELGQLTDLQTLDVGQNELTGSIPAELGNLTKIRRFVVGSNNMSGDIPEALSGWTNIEAFVIDRNDFTGCVPPELRATGNNLGDLDYCAETPSASPSPSPTPTSEFNCTNGTVVANHDENAGLVGDCETLLGLKDDLRGDVELDWSVDKSIASWDGITVGGDPRRVTKVVLAYRWMTGVVPAELAELGALKIINLTDNNLTGSIPSELGNLSNLRELDLGVNKLKGHIPSEIGQLTNLEILDLGQNDLTGPIPIELGNLTKMRRFVVGSNHLSGEIPQELTNWTELDLFVIDSNDFTGCAPAELRAPVHRLGDMLFCDEVPDLWNSRPTFDGGIDLGVTFIERLPRYPIVKAAYNIHIGDCPYPYEQMIGVVACPGQEGVKRDPAPGETVELTAHVWNFGDEASGEFEYEWRSDGNLIESGTHAGLAAGERALFEVEQQWPAETSYPVITFTVDPDDEVSELLEDNNRVKDWIKGSTIGIYFSPTSYASLSKSNENGQTIQSPEHWVHRNAEELNRLLTEAGLNEKIRLEQFYITPEKYERNDIKWYLDGWWAVWHGGHFNLDTFNRRPAIDKGLLHEWLHQLGAIDMYWIPYRDDHIAVPDANRPGEKAGAAQPTDMRNTYVSGSTRN